MSLLRVGRMSFCYSRHTTPDRTLCWYTSCSEGSARFGPRVGGCRARKWATSCGCYWSVRLTSDGKIKSLVLDGGTERLNGRRSLVERLYAQSTQMSEKFNSARDLDLIEFVCWASRIGLGGSRSGSAACKAPSMQPNYGGAQWLLQVVALQF